LIWLTNCQAAINFRCRFFTVFFFPTLYFAISAVKFNRRIQKEKILLQTCVRPLHLRKLAGGIGFAKFLTCAHLMVNFNFYYALGCCGRG
jgi:hypothetical protein